MPLEPYGREQALEHLFNTTSGIHISLLSVLPVEGSGEVEISPAGYARQPEVNWTTESGNSTAATVRANADNINFGPYAEPVTFKGWAAYDAVTGGNLVASGVFVGVGSGDALTITVAASYTIQFQPGDLAIGISSDSGVCDLEGAGWSFPWSSPWSGGS